MTRWVIETRPDDYRVARFAVIAVGLAVLESGFPSPIPGVKPGMANIITLMVMQQFGWRMAAWVSMLRILGAAIFLGSFLTPGFFLSLGGGVASLAALAVARGLPPRWFGMISWSLLASFAHMAGQLGVIFIGFIPSAGVLNLMPILAAAALVFGWVNGWIALRLAVRPDDGPATSPARSPVAESIES